MVPAIFAHRILSSAQKTFDKACRWLGNYLVNVETLFGIDEPRFAAPMIESRIFSFMKIRMALLDSYDRIGNQLAFRVCFAQSSQNIELLVCVGFWPKFLFQLALKALLNSSYQLSSDGLR